MGVRAADQLTGIAPAMSCLREQAWRLVNLVGWQGAKEDGRKVPDACSGRRPRCRPSASLRVALGQSRQMSALGAAPLVPGGTSRDVATASAGSLHEAFPCQQICQRNVRIPANTARHWMAWRAQKIESNRDVMAHTGTGQERNVSLVIMRSSVRFRPRAPHRCVTSVDAEHVRLVGLCALL